MAGGHHVEPLDRVGLVAGAEFVEVVGGIGELGEELGGDFGADFVAAWADAGADGGQKVAGVSAEVHLHFADGFGGDAGQGAAPAGGYGGDGGLFAGSTRRMGTQSAVWMARRRPGRSVMLASPRHGSVEAVSKRWITSEWNCFRVISGRSLAPVAVWKRRRFFRTFSRVSQSVKPRLRTFSPSRGLMPPGAVLKAWISQGSLEKAGTWRSLRPLDVPVDQLRAGTGGTRDLRTLRLGDVLVAGTIV